MKTLKTKLLLTFFISGFFLFGLAGVSEVKALDVIPGLKGFGTDTRAAYDAANPPEICVVNSLATSTGPPSWDSAYGPNNIGVFKGTLIQCLEGLNTLNGETIGGHVVKPNSGKIVLFGTSGTIHQTGVNGAFQPYTYSVDSYTTIAGQTSPNPGILFRNILIYGGGKHDILIQHVRGRMDGVPTLPYGNHKAFNFVSCHNVVVDHISSAWGADSQIEFYYNGNYEMHDITLSNSLLAEARESMGTVDEEAGNGKNTMAVANGYYATQPYNLLYYNNLIMNTKKRNPKIRWVRGTIINNYMYNNRDSTIMFVSTSGHTSASIIGNIMDAGPMSGDYGTLYMVDLSYQEWNYPIVDTELYLYDNRNKNGVQTDSTDWSMVNANANNANALNNMADYKVTGENPLSDAPYYPTGITLRNSINIKDHIIANVGAYPAFRDSLDIRFINEMTNGIGPSATVKGAPAAGDWPVLAVKTITLDIPANPHADNDGDGYTNLEEWLHCLACDVEDRVCPWCGTDSCDYFVAQNKDPLGTGDGSSYLNRMSVATHNARIFSPGDVICLVGTISSQVVIPSSGTDGNRIIYRGDYAGHAGVLTASSGGGAINGKYKDYITIDGLEIKNGKIGIAFLNDCDYVTIKRCKIHDMAVAGSKGILISSNTMPKQRNSNIIIGGAPGDGNEIYNVGVDTGGGDIITAHVDGFLISYNKGYGGNADTGIDGYADMVSDNGVIEYNEFFDHIKSSSIPIAQFGEDGIDLKGSTNVHVRYNHIYGNRANGVSINYSDAMEANCSDIYIYNNLIHDNRTNIVIGNLDQNAYVYNNIIYGSKKFHGISCYADGSNIHIYNNTLVNNHTTINDGSQYELLVVNGSNYYIKNNIFYSNTQEKLVYHSNTTNVNFDNNRYYYTGGAVKIRWNGVYKTLAEIKALGQEATGSEGNPGLTNIGANNFTLADGSACIDKGLNLGSPYNQGLNSASTWPNNISTLDQNSYGSWEIGAFVYADVPIPDTTCASQSGTCCDPLQFCKGGSSVSSSNCDDVCCVGGDCEDVDPADTCQSKGYQCCNSCQIGTAHSEYNGNCPGKICCEDCFKIEPFPVGPSGISINIKNPIATSDFSKLIENALTWSLSIIGSLALLMIIIGGIMYMSSTGDEQRVLTAKKIVTYAIIGLALILIAYSIIKVLDRVLT